MLYTTIDLLEKADACSGTMARLRKFLGGNALSQPKLIPLALGLVSPKQFSFTDEALFAVQATTNPKEAIKRARLFACDVAKRVLPAIESNSKSKKPRLALEAARGFATGKVSEEDFKKAARALSKWYSSFHFGTEAWYAEQTVHGCMGDNNDRFLEYIGELCDNAQLSKAEKTGLRCETSEYIDAYEAEEKWQMGRWMYHLIRSKN